MCGPHWHALLSNATHTSCKLFLKHCLIMAELSCCLPAQPASLACPTKPTSHITGWIGKATQQCTQYRHLIKFIHLGALIVVRTQQDCLRHHMLHHQHTYTQFASRLLQKQLPVSQPSALHKQHKQQQSCHAKCAPALSAVCLPCHCCPCHCLAAASSAAPAAWQPPPAPLLP